MRTVKVMLLSMLLASGCREQAEIPDGFCGNADMKGTVFPDMTPATPNCSAAKGLPGDNLLCVDFDKLTMLNDPALAGWNFSFNTGSCTGWEIKAGVLQVKDFGTVGLGNCGFTLPSIDFSKGKNSQYSTVIISVSHKVTMDIGTTNINQLAQIYFGTANPLFFITETSGVQPSQRLVLMIDKDNLPTQIMKVVQLLFQVVSAESSGKSGWQISSIAINAS